jgi:hypothetical protein
MVSFKPRPHCPQRNPLINIEQDDAGLGSLCSDRAILSHESLTLEPNISQGVYQIHLYCCHCFFVIVRMHTPHVMLTMPYPNLQNLQIESFRSIQLCIDEILCISIMTV